jgi:hypothetical protein
MIHNRRTVSIITPPASFGVTAADMQAYLNLSPGQDDDLLDAFIEAAYDAVRQYCKRSILTETLEMRMDGFPGYDEARELALGPGVHVVSVPWLTNRDGRVIDLPFGPVASITSINTFGRDNVEATFDAANYEADASRVYLNESATWPVDLRNRDAVAVRYVSGEASPPKALIHSIKVHVAAMYECREGCDMPAACKSILGPYRRMDQMGFE